MILRAAFLVSAAIALLLPGHAAWAQDRAATLADIRQNLTVLSVELQGLKRELSTTGTAMSNGSATSGEGPLARLDAIESELRRLTATTEELSHRIDRVVQDGTNRIGDLEFRLTELEGGDLGAVGQTAPLGGELPLPSTPLPPPAPQVELAVGEQADFDAAVALMTEGTPADAHDALNRFLETYPRSPLAAEAHLFRGDTLKALGNPSQAGRAYLESYTLAELSNPGLAAEALYKLGDTLAGLDQVHEACITLGQVGAAFPGTKAAEQAQSRLGGLICP
ncbi:MAG: tetratricopeptide repeat protein [Rhodobacteraceae bacterium]|nr:tetratricopeptide repeat protein [Paracoccaceae bacterium]